MYDRMHDRFHDPIQSHFDQLCIWFHSFRCSRVQSFLQIIRYNTFPIFNANKLTFHYTLLFPFYEKCNNAASSWRISIKRTLSSFYYYVYKEYISFFRESWQTFQTGISWWVWDEDNAIFLMRHDSKTPLSYPWLYTPRPRYITPIRLVGRFGV